uniref:Uncharacterized protein n=1 Tax=Phaeomonas parva TaxID=124430 RepID=A0A6U4J283_9STRA|mmetsp:Transcript_42070/g.131773  ORF Transcript_42070/g.131773 Transcript_42070/m.131773 type:complete len:155 (+) Transcript_42070:479-943(+)
MGVAETFAHHDWKVVCSNGVLAHGMYWDTIAFRDAKGKELNRLDLQHMHDHFRQGNELIPAQSCFGGLAIYEREAMRPCSYMQSWAPDSVRNECEHIDFNKCIAENNGGEVFSNPRMKTWYGEHHMLRKTSYRADWWCFPSDTHEWFRWSLELD